ncbi:MAG: hypothetical protein GXO69_08335 [Acidobacteria bacterium]|nr:hypothetical protein [Acidobacteriota bacterium]
MHCPDEQRLIAAIRSDKLTDEMRNHLKNCEYCREVGEITGQLQTVASSLPAPHVAPAPVMYRLAKQADPDIFDRVLFPIRIVQLFFVIVAVAAAVAVLFAGTRFLFQAVRWFDSLPCFANLTGTAAFAVRIGAFGGLVIAVFLLITAFFMWLSDVFREWRPVRLT